jgi:hypothetical protein
MTGEHPSDEQGSHREERLPSRAKWVLAGFLAVAAFFLVTEHRAHLLGWLPWLILLACPLMHLFHGHGGHGSHEGRGGGRAPDEAASPPGSAHRHGHHHGDELESKRS